MVFSLCLGLVENHRLAFLKKYNFELAILDCLIDRSDSGVISLAVGLIKIQCS